MGRRGGRFMFDMTSVLPDPSTEFGARVARRLADEVVAWLTVVDGAGTPWPRT